MQLTKTPLNDTSSAITEAVAYHHPSLRLTSQRSHSHRRSTEPRSLSCFCTCHKLHHMASLGIPTILSESTSPLPSVKSHSF